MWFGTVIRAWANRNVPPLAWYPALPQLSAGRVTRERRDEQFALVPTIVPVGVNPLACVLAAPAGLAARPRVVMVAPAAAVAKNALVMRLRIWILPFLNCRGLSGDQ